MSFDLNIHGIIFLLALLLLSSCGNLQNLNESTSSHTPIFEHEILENESVEYITQEEKIAEVETPIKKTTETNSLELFVKEWHGTPHQMGGMSKNGIDCSGFAIIAYKEVFNKEFKNRRAEDLLTEMTSLNLKDLQYGDLVFFKIKGRRIDHVGIYLYDQKFAHASASHGVMISSLEESYFKNRFYQGGRFPN